MKFTAVLILSLFHFSTISQVSKAHIQFAIDVEALDTTQQTKQMVGMFYDSNMKLYFTKTQSRVDYKMGRIYVASVVLNSLSDSALVLQSGPMGKFAKYQSSKDFSQKEAITGTVEIKKIDEFKTILGYSCQKIIYINDGKEVIYWVTDEIKLSPELGQDVVNSDLPGFPLEFTAHDGSVKLHYKASNIELEIRDEEAIFSTDVPEGFKLMPQ